ncbi:biopolymer transporter ExbD [Pseudomethylobacillus aquaticus]|uniref:Biopolymer transporter ExbD n=1 Tax=Pseudomethylobacillus aquaticus TaxID=2676064 RepID=A0A3N0V3A5_9PROT|nr:MULTISPECIES: biopolymer transporter ExbD [Methylophilaceae]ROH87286.1 biopolymer transporter ExbD [Pseudomethylobacillus aquaticus]
MNFQRGKRHEELEMNLVPLIDVLLVIIIFLVVSTTFSRMSELQINLPSAEATPQQNKPELVNVDLDAAGNYQVNGTNVASPTVAAISAALRTAAGEQKEPTIVINADGASNHQSVINIMEAARAAGYSRITFTTQISSGS